jgi:hypothetical protein
MAEPFFLDSDDAKSMGDIDYMRTARKVKKSFPKTRAWGDAFETESEVSSSSKLNGSSQQDSQTSAEMFQVYGEPKADATVRRKAASDLDMFRKMAKDVRKS